MRTLRLQIVADIEQCLWAVIWLGVQDKIFRPISTMLSPPLWPLYILRMPLVLTPGFRCVCPGMLSYPILHNTHSSSWWKSTRWNITWFYADPSCLTSSSDWRWWNSFFDRLVLFLSPFIIVLMWFLVEMHTQSNGSQGLPSLIRQVDHPMAITNQLASSQEKGWSTQSSASAASLCATKLTSLPI